MGAVEREGIRVPPLAVSLSKIFSAKEPADVREIRPCLVCAAQEHAEVLGRRRPKARENLRIQQYSEDVVR